MMVLNLFTAGILGKNGFCLFITEYSITKINIYFTVGQYWSSELHIAFCCNISIFPPLYPLNYNNLRRTKCKIQIQNFMERNFGIIIIWKVEPLVSKWCASTSRQPLVSIHFNGEWNKTDPVKKQQQTPLMFQQNRVLRVEARPKTRSEEPWLSPTERRLTRPQTVKCVCSGIQSGVSFPLSQRHNRCSR